jgi:peptidoglycan-N-acetylglucosamine deacetylase
MWNILAGDWDINLDSSICFERVKKKTSEGDIIVFHDSEKAWERMSFSLPKLLEYFSTKGYVFAKIDL